MPLEFESDHRHQYDLLVTLSCEEGYERTDA
jgi:hypothetical protein